jgi:hypothetical protein
LDRYLKHFTVLMGIVDAVLVALTLLSRVPAWLASGLIVLLAVLPLLWAQAREIRQLKTRVHETDRGTRHYYLRKTRIAFGAPKVAGYLSAIRTTHHKGIALAELGYIDWSIGRRGDSDPDFAIPNSQPTTVVNAHRGGTGRCEIHPMHKSKRSLASRITFDPPLRPDETFEIDVEATIPVYVSSTLETLRRRPKPAISTTGEKEFVSIHVGSRTDCVSIEALFPESLGITGLRLEAIRKTTHDSAEDAFLAANQLIRNDTEIVNGQRCQVLRLERELPPVGVYYRICWTPPERDPFERLPEPELDT